MDNGSKFTPAPYKGAQGRLQSLNQQIAGASAAGGGTSNQSALRPLIAGVERGLEASAMQSGVMSELSNLRLQQQRDSGALQKQVFDRSLAIQNKPSTLETIETAIKGVMVLEAGTNALANATKNQYQKIEKVEVGKDDKGEPIYKDVEHEDTSYSGIGSVAHTISRALGYGIGPIRRSREAQDADAQSQTDAINDTRDEHAINNFQHLQQTESYAKLIDDLNTYNENMEKAYGELTDKIDTFNKELSDKIEAGDKADAELAKFRSEVIDLRGRSWKPLNFPSRDDLVRASTGLRPFKPFTGQSRENTFMGDQAKPGEGPQIAPVIDAIAKGESGGSFKAMNQGGNKSTGVIGATRNSTNVIGEDITKMTIDELRRRSKLPLNDPDRVFVAGRLQWAIKGGAFEDAVKSAGLSGSDLFSEENQVKMEVGYLMDMPAVKRYLKGEGTVEDAAKAIAKTWASVKMPGGGGYYDDDGLNKATVDSSSIIGALQGMRPMY